MHRVPNYPNQRVSPYPSPRSGLTPSDLAAARAAAHASAGGVVPASLKSEAEEFLQAIRIDIGGLEMRAQDGTGARFEAARKFCELQHSLMASTTAGVEDKLAALNDIDAAVDRLHARFPGVFAGAKDLVVSAREAIEEIEQLKKDLEAADPETAAWLLDGRSAMLARHITDDPFKDYLWDELTNCWNAVKATHSDERVRDLLVKHLDDYPPTRSERVAGSSSGPSANDIASLRAAESTKVTLPPLTMHVEPAGTFQLKAENVAKLCGDIEKFLEELLPLHSSHLSGRLLTGEVAALIDQIALHDRSGDAALFAKLGRGLDELRLTHKDPGMRAEMSKVLGCCFEPGDAGAIRAITGERRLRMRVAFVLTEAPQIAHGAYKCLEDFAFKLVDDIKRDLGDDSPLMVELFDGFDRFDESPNLNQLAEAMYRRSW